MPSDSSRLTFASGGTPNHDFPALEPVQNRIPGLLRQLLPRRVERKTEFLRQAVHHSPIPRIGVIFESLAHKTAADNTPFRIRHQQLRVRKLVDAQPATGPARTLRVVEHEVLGLYVAVNEVMRLAAESLVKPLGPFQNLNPNQPIAYQAERW